jgi:mannosyltransferase OCH1-like enzyme
MKLILGLCFLFATLFGSGDLTSEDLELQQFYATHSSVAKSGSGIPKILHFIWLGPSDFPSSSIPHIKEWMRLHPDWKVCFWTDRDRPLPVQGMEKRYVHDVHELYDASDNFGEKSEILRYKILFEEGGLYADHDTTPLRSFDDLHESYDFYTGLEEIGPSILSTAIFPSTHLIAAKPGHPIFEKTLAWLKDHWDQLEQHYPGSDASSIYNRVKHRSFTALQHGVKTLSEGDAVLPPHYFSLKDAQKALYATHEHAGTWYQPKNELEEKLLRRVEAIEVKLQRIQKIFVAIVLLSLIGGMAFFKKRKLSSLLLCLFLVGCKEQNPSTEFERLMGKSTEHWKYMQTEEDKTAFRFFETLYDKNKKFLSEKIAQQKIPHTVHFIWLGPKPFPPQSVENVRSWMAKNPTWRVKFWTDRDRPLPCSRMELCYVDDFQFTALRHCYETSQNWGEKSDVLRYEILYQEGGVYADHDANCLCPFDTLHANFDFYCGLEAPHPPFVDRNITTGNGVLGSRPGHPVIKQVLNFIGTHWDQTAQQIRGKDACSKMELVLARTYIALTNSLKTSVDRDQNIDIVLPSAYFFAKTGIPSLYSKHFYATAWAESNQAPTALSRKLEKKLSQLQKQSTRLQNLCLLGLSVHVVFLIAILRRKRSNA